MKNTYQLYQVDAFTKDLFRGNPAGVVLGASGLTDSKMQDIARELNNSETAFVFETPDNEEYDVEVRYFTPTTEVPICGHATIAAHYVRACEKNLSSSQVIQKTKAGILPVQIIRHDNDYTIVMTQGTVEFGNPIEGKQRDALLAALNIGPNELDERCPIQAVSTGHSKVMVGIKSLGVLNGLKPNMSLLSEISNSIGCNGYFVFTFDSKKPDILTNGRMFAPAIGINEDPVTGNANGPLGAYIVHHKLVDISGNTLSFKAQQGEAIKRPGVVDVRVDIENGEPVKVRVGGEAIIVFKCDIFPGD